MGTYNAFARKSNNQEDWKLVDKFNTAYWSGLDVQVYANNILLDESIQVAYQMVEQVRPYYGYASYVPDRMHHGSRIITGELSMNFKTDGYLFSLLNLIRTQADLDNWLPASTQQSNSSATLGMELGYNTDTVIRPPLGFHTDEGILQSQKLQDGSLTGDQLSQFVQAKKKESSSAVVYKKAPDVLHNYGMFETKKNGFDINIIFGASLNAARELRYFAENEYLTDGIVVPKKGLPTEGVDTTATGIKLIGVSIMGKSTSVIDDGRPIIETYSFQARDVQILSSRAIAGDNNLSASAKVANRNPQAAPSKKIK